MAIIEIKKCRFFVKESGVPDLHSKLILTYDKSLVEKLQLLEELERKCLFTIIDGLISKKRLKDNLSNLLAS